MKHKKKLTWHENQKIAGAHYRNEFFRKIKLVIDTCCGKDIYPLIPQRILECAYLCRSTPFKFRADYNSTISSRLLIDSKVILTHIFKNKKITLPPHDLEITLTEYYTVVFTIISLQSFLKSTDFDQATQVKEVLQIFPADTVTNEKASHEMYNILYTYNIGLSDLRDTLYSYKYDLIIPTTFPAENENVIIITSAVPERISIEVDSISRPALRVGWAFAFVGPTWLELKPSDIGVNGLLAEIPLKVYIQSHALNRLMERIDCFHPSMVQFTMINSLFSPLACYDSNKNILIEYKIFANKAGYFRADIINGIILIRTFLFITNNGTPEGQLLEKNTGLKKLDKKYLAIDKLSTFMTTDIDKNEEVRQIFKSSGCQCLLDLYENVQPIVTKKSDNFNAELILKYLYANKSNGTVPLLESQLQEVNS
jgi:hypothetical protein